MLNYLREIFSLLIGRAGRRSHLRVHLTIRNIFDLLTESANSNTKGVCMKASDNQGAVYVGAGSKPILTLSSLHPLSSLRRQGSILMNKSWIPHQVRDDKLSTGNDRQMDSRLRGNDKRSLSNSLLHAHAHITAICCFDKQCCFLYSLAHLFWP